MLQHLRFAVLFANALGLTQPATAADVTVTLPAGDNFVVENNTSTIERLSVDEATGNISHNGQLFVHATGENTSVGASAGNTSTTGNSNSAFGRLALRTNSTGSNNSAFGSIALRFNSTGNANSAFGADALLNNTTGSDNSAFGNDALRNNNGGSYNSAFGKRALFNDTSGSSNSAFGNDALLTNSGGSYNSAFGGLALASNQGASSNAAFGYAALTSNTIGFDNAAFGHNALRANSSGDRNSAFGQAALRNSTASNSSAFGNGALYRNTSGLSNSAFGQAALRNNITGSNNSAFGLGALYVSTGASNAAFGREALRNTTGTRNIGIGDGAGINHTSGNNNIYIGNFGSNTESGKIRIGEIAQTETFIEGISGNTASGGSTVLINSSNELHTLVSSLRFKEGVRDMGETSELLMKLRPVTFRYREAVASGDTVDEYGLIAEEVEKVAPELVAYDEEGQPFSVRYHVLPSLLLNEVQKQQQRLDRQLRTIATQEHAIRTLLARVEEVESRLVLRTEKKVK